MTALLLLLALLPPAGWLFARRARRLASRWTRPAEEWDAEDVDRWLALIEPFPLPFPTPRS
jgi:hypothetical protein